MSSGSTKPTNTTVLISNLNLGETADLLSKFEACRKTLACPQCAKRRAFRHNGSTKTEPPPPQPIFFCSNGCGVSFRVATIRSVVYSSLSISSQLSPIKENLGFPELLRKFQFGIRKIYKHLNMVQRLTNKLAAAKSEIEELRNINARFLSKLNRDHVSFSQPEPFLAAASQLSLNFPWHNTTSTPWRNPE